MVASIIVSKIYSLVFASIFAVIPFQFSQQSITLFLFIIVLIALSIFLFKKFQRIKKLKDELKKNSSEILSELQKEQYFMNLLMDSIPDKIYFKDAESRFIRVNKEMMKSHGVNNLEDILGKTDRDFFGESHSKEALEDERAILKNRISIREKIESEDRVNGEKTWVVTTKLPLLDENGNLIGTFGISRDITKLINTEEELRNEIATKNKFFSIIAHDLKNPFTSIIGLSKHLVESHKELSQEEIIECVEYINDSANITFKLLENLLDWSRSQIGSIKISPIEICVRDIILIVIGQLNANAKQKRITINFDISEDHLVFADHSMITTVIRNLVSNAIKFTAVGGEINIYSLLKNGFVEITIQDNGLGIKKENISKLFDVSSHLTTQGTMNEKGTGLGLVLCKEFVTKNDGEILVESKIGEGSKFTIKLPSSGNSSAKRNNFKA